jgi:hypothetical protein
MFLGLKGRSVHILLGLDSGSVPKPIKRCWGCLAPGLGLGCTRAQQKVLGVPITWARVGDRAQPSF